MKKLLAIILSLIMTMTVMASVPFSASADPEVLEPGESSQETTPSMIQVMDEKGAWDGVPDCDFELYNSTDQSNVIDGRGGLSYNAETNTLTMNNVNATDYFFGISICNMGDITINLIGTNKVICMTVAESNATITGTGSLELCPRVYYERNGEVELNNEFLGWGQGALEISYATVTIDNSATVTINAGEQHCINVYSETELTANTVANAFSYAGNVNEPIEWTYSVEGGPYETPESNDTMFILTEFPATNIYKLDGSDAENNYYIKSNWASDSYNDSYYFAPLVERDGLWFEDNDPNTYQEKCYHVSNGEYDGDYSFTAYGDEAEFPATLVTKGTATACLKLGTDSNYPVYTKGGDKYVRSFCNYYNEFVEPTNFYANKYTEAMLKLHGTGNARYLEFIEEIPVGDYNVDPVAGDTGGYVSLDGQTYDSYWSAYEANQRLYKNNVNDWLAENNYTASEITINEPYQYYGSTLNEQLIFTPGSGECNHNWQDVRVIKAATCTAKGSKEVVCSKCQATDTVDIKPLGHNMYVDEVGRAATCTEAGNLPYCYCRRCQKYFIDSDGKNPIDGKPIIKAQGHDWDAGKITTKATCTSNGVKTYTCTRCNKTKTEAVKATGHTYKTTTTKATLSKNGSVVTACTVCGAQKSKTTIYYPKTFKLSDTEYTFNGKDKTPTVTVKDTKGNKLVKNTDYTVKYEDNRKVGTATVTVKFKGDYTGTKKLTFKINPKGTELTKLTAKSKSFVAKWDKQTTQTTGYQLQYATDSKFTKNKETETVSKNSTTSKTIKKLKASKKYYVRIRTYKTVDGKKYYSDWSKSKTVTTKK